MANGVQQQVAEAPMVNEANQRYNYGGFHIGAAMFGWLVTVGVGVLITAFLTATGSAIALTVAGGTNQIAASAPTVGLVSGLLLLVGFAVAYYAGGYVAGRMSRFDGGRQGLGVWLISLIITIVLAIIGVIFGASYNLLQQINFLHVPVQQGSLTTGGLITLLIAVVVTAAAAILGGKAGEYYHRKIDQAGAYNPQVQAAETEASHDTPTATRRPSFGETLDNRDVRDE